MNLKEVILSLYFAGAPSNEPRDGYHSTFTATAPEILLLHYFIVGQHRGAVAKHCLIGPLEFAIHLQTLKVTNWRRYFIEAI